MQNNIYHQDVFRTLEYYPVILQVKQLRYREKNLEHKYSIIELLLLF